MKRWRLAMVALAVVAALATAGGPATSGLPINNEPDAGWGAD